LRFWSPFLFVAPWSLHPPQCHHRLSRRQSRCDRGDGSATPRAPAAASRPDWWPRCPRTNPSCSGCAARSRGRWRVGTRNCPRTRPPLPPRKKQDQTTEQHGPHGHSLSAGASEAASPRQQGPRGLHSVHHVATPAPHPHHHQAPTHACL